MSALDKAIQEYRANPSEENKQRILLLQQLHVRTFHTSQADSFVRRTR